MDISGRGGIKIRAKRIGIPRSTDSNVRADLALVQLSRPVTFSEKIQPICLPSKKFRTSRKSDCQTAGWGLGKGAIFVQSTG